MANESNPIEVQFLELPTDVKVDAIAARCFCGQRTIIGATGETRCNCGWVFQPDVEGRRWTVVIQRERDE